MTPDFLHGPEGCVPQRQASAALSALLRRLHVAYERATDAGLCRVAACAFAVEHFAPPFSSVSKSFRLRAHPSDRPALRGAELCSCASSFAVGAAQLSPTEHPEHTSDVADTIDASDQLSASLSPVHRQQRHQLQLINRYKRSKELELQNNVRRLFAHQYHAFDCNGNLIDAPYDDSPQLTTACHSPSHSPNSSLPPRSSSAAPQTPPLYGCKHYARRCKLKAPCCGMFVSCRFCHDEAVGDDHQMDRFEVDTVLCTVCMTEQPIGPECVNCSIRFARYYCTKCRFFDNSPDKHIYHCDRCHVCRLGKGLGIDVYHCDKCDACVSMDSKNNHRCLNRSLHANCPICHVYLFTSVDPVVFMKCGHTMHKQCFDQYTLSNYQCPICMRSLTDTKQHFENIDKIMESQLMPPEYACKRSQIVCNDCHAKSVVPFHFVYHKCAQRSCGSYNTFVVSVFDQPVVQSSASASASAPAASSPHTTTAPRMSAQPPPPPLASSAPPVVTSTPAPAAMEDAAVVAPNAWQFIM
eukprot:TRINITY_DN2349_c0_g1_i1.p1 TRINITY_DN2349_c0_g1~~TRINITY_DN2349_c0_g1_i1.p1  ORF type:complete len:576 (-),score=59.17 TRINITY_DN2349_c0_g1_i1:3389-4960(-)